MRSLASATLAACIVATTMAVPAAASDVPRFTVLCPFSHRARHDPIVHPGHPGAAHTHDFFGNRSTDATSTFRSLRRGRTTCGVRADKAAYWIPTLYAGGRPHRPSQIKVYYTTRLQRRAALRPFPHGLKMIAGDADARGAQSLSVVHWDCGGNGPKANRPRPVDCGSGVVQANVIFPDCWDGRRKDSRNHRRHVAYSVDPDDDGRYRCTRRHPVELPRIKLQIQWPVHDGTKVRLSSGPAISMHADFFDAWKRRPLKRLIQRCLVAGINCGNVGKRPSTRSV